MWDRCVRMSRATCGPAATSFERRGGGNRPQQTSFGARFGADASEDGGAWLVVGGLTTRSERAGTSRRGWRPALSHVWVSPFARPVLGAPGALPVRGAEQADLADPAPQVAFSRSVEHLVSLRRRSRPTSQRQHVPGAVPRAERPSGGHAAPGIQARVPASRRASRRAGRLPGAQARPPPGAQVVGCPATTPQPTPAAVTHAGPGHSTRRLPVHAKTRAD